jgi:hypothetical protein
MGEALLLAGHGQLPPYAVEYPDLILQHFRLDSLLHHWGGVESLDLQKFGPWKEAKEGRDRLTRRAHLRERSTVDESIKHIGLIIGIATHGGPIKD